ncbi:MAG: hypothetical protein ACOYL6_17480 [Bacteriovoracaceae bacterium]
MRQFKATIKREFMDLLGEISIDELVGNTEVSRIIKDIASDLSDVSLTEHYRHLKGGK